MKKKHLSIILAGVLVASVVLNIFSFNTTKAMADVVVNSNSESTDSMVNQNYIYLSDMEYDKDKSSVGYGSINMDKNIDGGKIKLIQEGEVVEFNKGIGAHARSQVVYDVSKYSKNYNRFVAHLGVDKSMNGKGDGVIFKVSTSEDGKNWTDKVTTEVLKSNANSKFVDINIEGANYLRLIAEKNGNNAADHSVYADARLVKANYNLNSENYQGIRTLADYDKEISKYSVEENYTSHKKLVQERELVNRLGYHTLQNSIKSNTSVKDTVDWLLSDKKALESFIEVGEIDQPARFLTALSKLYTEYKNDMGNEGNKLLYKKMLIALAAGWSSDIYTSPLSFSMPYPNYDVVTRFKSMKDLYDKNKFARMDEFKNYNMELLRMVMSDAISNEDLLWLNGYSADKYPTDIESRLSMWKYGIGYISPNYNQSKLYDEKNRQAMTEKYSLDKYNIKYGERGVQHTWMIMEAGGICWNTSRFGQNLLKSNGVATVGIFQPGHEAILQYKQQSDGRGYWSINNNVGGWQKARTAWIDGSGYRMLLDWGDNSFTTKNTNQSYNAAYTLLAQEALESPNYEKSNYYNLEANSYTNSADKIKAYNKALEELNINFDSFEGLIKEYSKDNTKTSKDWRALAEKVINSYTYYPYALVDLLKVITPHLEGADIVDIDIAKTQALTKATQATASNVYQYKDCQAIAKSLRK